MYCPECHALWAHDDTCERYFHTALYWEWDYGLLEVHHLLVLCYHLQHPSLYTPEALAYAREMLPSFLDEDADPRLIAKQVRTDTKTYRIQGEPAAYAHPIQWAMTLKDVVEGGRDQYYQNVRLWGACINKDLQQMG